MINQNVIERIEQQLKRLLEGSELVEPLKSAARYAVFPGGKRLRPLLALQFCADLHGRVDALTTPAAALELVHCASLVHDDLPSFDNDDCRRGKPSCHRAFGESTAILVGDALVPIAFAAIACCDYSPLDRNYFVKRLSNAFVSICSGQQLDLLTSAARPELSEIHRLKTGALFGASFSFGAIGAGRLDIEEEAYALGMLVGELFQLVDDYLDLHNSEAKGRDAGSDIRNDKSTYFNDHPDKPLNILNKIDSEIALSFERIGRQVRPEHQFNGVSLILDGIRNRLPSAL